MLEQMKWQEARKLWDLGQYSFPRSLSAPVSADTVQIECNPGSRIFGYDWLENTEAEKRKKLIEKNPLEFLYFTKPSNKGTILTARLLAECETEEERAALWIAANARELSEYGTVKNLGHYANLLYLAACEFLIPRCGVWHHAMKKLVPAVMIPYSVLDSMIIKDAAPVMGLIQMNTFLLQNSWTILRYASAADEESARLFPHSRTLL